MGQLARKGIGVDAFVTSIVFQSAAFLSFKFLRRVAHRVPAASWERSWLCIARVLHLLARFPLDFPSWLQLGSAQGQSHVLFALAGS